MEKSDLKRDNYMLKGKLARRGYDWWWHSFTAIDDSTQEKKAFYVEYYIMNPGLSQNEVVLGQEKDQSNRPSYAMLNVGTWGTNKKQLHAFFPISDCIISKHELNVQFGDNLLTEHLMKGHVFVSKEEAANPGYMCDAGEMKFDLKIYKLIPFNVGYGASSFFRTINAFEMFWHAEGMKTEYEGYVVFDGRRYTVTRDTSYGYADKNWGKDFTSPWVWFSSCNLYSIKHQKKLTNSVFDIGGGCPKIYNISLNRRLLIDFYYEGVEYEYNFSKFWTNSKIDFNCYEEEDKIIWDIEAKNKETKFIFNGKCLKKDMLFINYEAPNGKKLHNRLWNGGTGYGTIKLLKNNDEVIDEISFENGGCEYGEYEKFN